MPQIFWDLQQGTADWYQARMGIPTASNFHLIMTPAHRKLSASRKKYACRLILERLLNWQADSLEKIEHIADGKAREPDAIAQLELVYGFETKTVGFVKTNDGRWGASPDRAANFTDQTIDTCVEVKSPTPAVQMERFLFGGSTDYQCQVQGQLLVAQADKAIFFSYNPRMPPILEERGRDDGFIHDLSNCLEQFSDELEEWTHTARRWGPFQAFEQLVTPVEAERGKMVTNPISGGEMTDQEMQDWLDRPVLGGGL